MKVEFENLEDEKQELESFQFEQKQQLRAHAKDLNDAKLDVLKSRSEEKIIRKEHQKLREEANLLRCKNEGLRFTSIC